MAEKLTPAVSAPDALCVLQKVQHSACLLAGLLARGDWGRGNDFPRHQHPSPVPPRARRDCQQASTPPVRFVGPRKLS